MQAERREEKRKKEANEAMVNKIKEKARISYIKLYLLQRGFLDPHICCCCCCYCCCCYAELIISAQSLHYLTTFFYLLLFYNQSVARL